MDELGQLVAAVRKSPKYRRVCPEVIQNVGSHQLATRRKLKEAIKATKNKLHQVGGAYLDSGVHYAQWLAELQTAADSADEDRLRQACAEIMRYQSSTRERLPILDVFYAQTLSALPPVRSVLDIACGLNPLAIPWMPLSVGVRYYAYDMYTDMVDFLNHFMHIIHIEGQAQAIDVAHSPPARRVDLALILKSLPCIEHLDRSAGLLLLEAMRADHLLISFPVRSLGGLDRSMAQNYEAHFWELMADKAWDVERFEFATELAFLVHRSQ